VIVATFLFGDTPNDIGVLSCHLSFNFDRPIMWIVLTNWTKAFRVNLIFKDLVGSSLIGQLKI